MVLHVFPCINLSLSKLNSLINLKNICGTFNMKLFLKKLAYFQMVIRSKILINLFHVFIIKTFLSLTTRFHEKNEMENTFKK